MPIVLRTGPDAIALPAGKLRCMSADATTVQAPRFLVDSLQKFVSEHGGSASAVLQPVGRLGVRITLVGADGVLGDQMADDMPIATAAVAAVDQLTEAEGWDRELTTTADPRPGHWAKMAGWVARQVRFPKARNE